MTRAISTVWKISSISFIFHGIWSFGTNTINFICFLNCFLMNKNEMNPIYWLNLSEKKNYLLHFDIVNNVILNWSIVRSSLLMSVFLIVCIWAVFTLTPLHRFINHLHRQENLLFLRKNQNIKATTVPQTIQLKMLGMMDLLVGALKPKSISKTSQSLKFIKLKNKIVQKSLKKRNSR